MRHILNAFLAVSLLSGTAAFAQPGYQDHNDQGRNDPGRYDQNGNDQNRYNGNQERNHDAGQNRRAPDATSGTQRWSRGDRLPDQYRQNQYVVGDWSQHSLTAPPRGYRWVRNDNNDYFLVLASTGVIANVVYRDSRDQRWNQRYAHTYTYNDDRYYQDCRTSPNAGGIAAGALIGGLLGNAVGSGNGRTGATIAGVIAGGAVGAALTSNLDCQDRGYAYKTYYDGFNAGRANVTYKWANPGNQHRGEFRVANYYNDPNGFRCANYSQVAYIQGRPQQARGHACRQPDGAWVIVN